MTYFQGNNLHVVNSSELKEDNLGENCHVILRLYNTYCCQCQLGSTYTSIKYIDRINKRVYLEVRDKFKDISYSI